MELHSLKPAAGAVKKKKRIGRGQGSGHGGTSTRGHKGQKSRSGYSKKRNFEGGQMPIQMRLPKVGFKSPNRVAYTVFNVATLAEIAEKYSKTEISPAILIELGIVKKTDRIKILGEGELGTKLTVSAHAFSSSAADKIKAAGGSIETV